MSPSRAPPTGPSAATNGTTSTAAATSPTTTAAAPSKVGPHPGHITSSSQYTSESTLRAAQRRHNSDPAREDTYRLQGVQLIDNVREHLQLPLRTFATACVYYHRFRLSFRDAEYNYQDAALASLFVACKVEDTIKKSRDILAAAYNVKNPEKPAAADDKLFESPGKIIIGLERLILETIGFDFRTRYPQKLLAKTIRTVLQPSSSADNKSFFTTAYAMSVDMYKTFVPVKRTTFAMVAAVTELTALMLSSTGEEGGEDERVQKFRDFAHRKKGHGGRPAVLETMLDLLDLYVQHHKSTKLGATFDINRFMDIKIHLNKELESSSLSRHLGHCPRCEFAVNTSTSSSNSAGAPPSNPPPPSSSVPPSQTSTSSLTGSRTSGATMRFVFDPEAAKSEKETVDEFFREEFEEYEIEVDEPIPPPPPAAPQAPRRDDGGGGGGRGGRRFHGGGGGGGGHHRDRWGGGGGGHPHPGGGYRGDRHHRGRGRRH